MAYEFSNAAVKVSRVAGEDLSAAQYKFVKLDNGTGNVLAVDGATDRPFGVLQNDPESGEIAEITIVGGTKSRLAALRPSVNRCSRTPPPSP